MRSEEENIPSMPDGTIFAGYPGTYELLCFTVNRFEASIIFGLIILTIRRIIFFGGLIYGVFQNVFKL